MLGTDAEQTLVLRLTYCFVASLLCRELARGPVGPEYMLAPRRTHPPQQLARAAHERRGVDESLESLRLDEASATDTKPQHQDLSAEG